MKQILIQLEKSILSSPCWIWTGPIHRGYGRIPITGNTELAAHRVSYETLIGPIENGKDLHNICNKRACVNPTHLEQLSMSEHKIKHGSIIDNKCIKHPDIILRVVTQFDGYTRRVCKKCAYISAVKSLKRKEVNKTR